ncbi:hypothetical protein A4A49_33978 [Nicotiana attenuata]|uniref:Uncharacterized protein n=1 Tax=Nicotiana attenuata TaxID=49451 RepID=A0A1J6IP83_NICAT|nr:hypothetical protein A4A49_33978 [Nicotiana attenuata]
MGYGGATIAAVEGQQGAQRSVCSGWNLVYSRHLRNLTGMLPKIMISLYIDVEEDEEAKGVEKIIKNGWCLGLGYFGFVSMKKMKPRVTAVLFLGVLS